MKKRILTSGTYLRMDQKIKDDSDIVSMVLLLNLFREMNLQEVSMKNTSVYLSKKFHFGTFLFILLLEESFYTLRVF